MRMAAHIQLALVLVVFARLSKDLLVNLLLPELLVLLLMIIKRSWWTFPVKKFLGYKPQEGSIIAHDVQPDSPPCACMYL
jgi:hypothetical protein